MYTVDVQVQLLAVIDFVTTFLAFKICKQTKEVAFTIYLNISNLEQQNG